MTDSVEEHVLLTHMVERVSDCEHLIPCVADELLQRCVDWYGIRTITRDQWAKVAYYLLRQYLDEGAIGRLFVLYSIFNFFEEEDHYPVVR